MSKVRGGCCEHRSGDDPPKRGAPQVDSGDDAEAVGDCCPQHRLAGSFEAKRWRRGRVGIAFIECKASAPAGETPPGQPAGRRRYLGELHPVDSRRRALAQIGANSSRQVHNAFQVVGLRKQIHEVHLLGAITGGEQGHEIARQRCRIARYINYAWRAQGSQHSRHAFSQATSGRIHHR